MSRKCPKKFRKEQAAKLRAAEAFTDAWMTSGLAYNLLPDYGIQLGCEEAETYAELFHAFKFPHTGEQIIADHRQGCCHPHYHAGKGTWTFVISVKGASVPADTEYTIVADGPTGAAAEIRAEEYLLGEMRKKFGPLVHVLTEDVEEGVPASIALFSWTDIRKDT
ncbi:hypothetical protein [Streptomyces sp. SID14515]|uniref:hypothetical protein n=1 Tax=Streptomyces sp. SID14515 TaxID=2706074 RepID=UPI0013C74F9F|nr:hypothetical protein [Streptomyces sp. SID14515]NEB42564.1 hypothetical protein [Streptomyces sp. SID14515]